MTPPLHPPGTGPDAPLRDAIAGSLRHASDLGQLLMGSQRRWTDALLSETRAHLSGCLNAIELTIGVQMGDNWLARPIEALGPHYCRSAIERHPAALAPLLVDHLRQRAAAALALRMTLMPPALLGEDIASAPSPTLPPALSDAVVALRLSVDPWHVPHPLDRPMRADLAAEPFCDLVWTATALLVEGLAARMGVDGALAAPVLAQAAQTIIARHDEQAGPFARAAYVATLAQGDGDARALAEEAALRHDLLLLAGLGAARTGMALEQALTLLIDGDAEDRAALARTVALDDIGHMALLDALAPIRDQDEDAVLPDLIARYRQLTPVQAAEHLARWRGPAPLVDKLARMGWGGV
ncbi:hypothetical protein LWE61_10295 [Sphingobium sufflavum]|uniref:hypothetical protein n=1 Tax=Sphingobium sufflavum TaxID=1129547 RepID=UPI001F3F1983|nr:hypothetical protein [Sphingobium sufflavum]MCE7796947.1 hypothetical protein [Sphingobium sufflavum]